MLLHYFYDPLCSWCYGFSPVIKAFQEKYKSEMDFEIISGGMVKGESERPIGELAHFLKDAHKRIEDTSGVKFGPRFIDLMEEGTTVFSSIPGAVALSVFKSFDEEKAISYASDIQYAIYYDGIDPNNEEAYAQLASKYEISVDEFLSRMGQDAYRKDAYDDFSVAQQFGIKGYPSTVLFAKDEYFLLNRGFTKLENLEKTLKSVKSSIK
jgi:putative protein-disulfide isomerase